MLFNFSDFFLSSSHYSCIDMTFHFTNISNLTIITMFESFNDYFLINYKPRFVPQTYAREFYGDHLTTSNGVIRFLDLPGMPFIIQKSDNKCVSSLEEFDYVLLHTLELYLEMAKPLFPSTCKLTCEENWITNLIAKNDPHIIKPTGYKTSFCRNIYKAI